MLHHLNEWAVGLGPFSRKSRGLFFILERFHLNHRVAFQNPLYHKIEELEHKLVKLGARCVLLTVSDGITEERILSRDAGFWHGQPKEVFEHACKEFIQTQRLLREQAGLSHVPTLEINTDSREWENYAKQIVFAMDDETE